MKTRIALLSTAVALAWAGNALADRPLLQVEEKIQVAATPAKAWAALGHFGDLSWHPAVAGTEITKGKDDRKGAVRSITTKDGARIVEELLMRSERRKALRYRILSSPLPVDGYVSTLKVVAGKEGGSTIVWSSQFRRKDEQPAAGADDAGARKVVAGIYTAGLESLRKRLEAAP